MSLPLGESPQQHHNSLGRAKARVLFARPVLVGYLLFYRGAARCAGYVQLSTDGYHRDLECLTIIIVIALALLGYVLRCNFRRFWHVLYTGDMEPDWEKLGADYFIAAWERKRFAQRKAAKKASALADAVEK